MTNTRNSPILTLGIALASPAVFLTLMAAEPAPYQPYIPADKHLDPAWVASLTAPGSPTVYRGESLRHVAMPCGGIGAGQIEITGDGTLATWWLANERQQSNHGHGFSTGYGYLHPIPPDPRFDHGFALRLAGSDQPAQVVRLDRRDFDDLRFTGTYPIATIDYARSGAALPVHITTEVFSPFVPMSLRDSANPVTVMHCRVTNTSVKPVEVTLAGWVENPRLPSLAGTPRRSSIISGEGITGVQMGAVLEGAPEPAGLMQDFEASDWGRWKTEGDAFGAGPEAVADLHLSNPISGQQGQRVATSFHQEKEEGRQGTLTSPVFRINRQFITFRIAGGRKPDTTAMVLLVDGKIVRSATGHNGNNLRQIIWDVKEIQGKDARIQVVDRATGGWGFIIVDDVRMTNDDAEEYNISQRAPLLGNGHPQYGNLALSLVGEGSASVAFADGAAVLKALAEGGVWRQCPSQMDLPPHEPGVGAVSRQFILAPGETREVTFLVSWWYPNLMNTESGCPGPVGHIYNNWYQSSAEVARWIAREFPRLHAETRRFRDTYFDTTVPRWLAERITMSVSTLACDNVQIWKNGRFYAWEGVAFCIGTCGHVYNFVAAISALFPELERSVRLQQDYAIAFDPASGRINYRGRRGDDPSRDNAYASDAQLGYVLKTYREHRMSPDRSFLDGVWPKTKRAIGYMIFLDGAARGVEPDGILETLQTFWDPMWFGVNPYNQSLYLAALRAAEEMALIENEPKLAARYHALFAHGSRFMSERMWNGSYYVHLYPNGYKGWGAENGVISPQYEQECAKGFIDAFNRDEPFTIVSTACDAQQLWGQNWSRQLDLGNLLPSDQRKLAAKSIYVNNFAPDIASVYALHPPRNRTLAESGDKVLVNGSWPTRERQSFENIHDKDDAWTGLEYEAACDLIAEGWLTEGLAVIRGVHDRYDGAKRNPWNEIEGAEHYSRAMHAWNILNTLSGVTYDGPAGIIGFSPRMTPESFRSFFSSANGWGSFSQRREAGQGHAELRVDWGRLALRELRLAAVRQEKPGTMTATLSGKSLACGVEIHDDHMIIRMKEDIVIIAGEMLEVSWK